MSKEYIEWTRKGWENVNPEDADLHAVLGVVSEAGEISDLYKKLLARGKSVTDHEVIDEIGDILFYIARLLDSCNSSFEEALEKNKVKLEYRWQFGKNKEEELKLQKMVSIPLSEPIEQGVMRYV